MTTPPPSSSTPSFFHDELRRALAEQSFGITAYALTHWTSQEAKARVELLEDVTVEIVLSIRGFQVAHISFDISATDKLNNIGQPGHRAYKS